MKFNTCCYNKMVQYRPHVCWGTQSWLCNSLFIYVKKIKQQFAQGTHYQTYKNIIEKINPSRNKLKYWNQNTINVSQHSLVPFDSWNNHFILPQSKFLNNATDVFTTKVAQLYVHICDVILYSCYCCFV